MKINTIIFDLGGVVLTNDWHYDCPEKFREYSDCFGITYDDMERGWNEYWPRYQIGEMSEEDFWEGFLTTAGAQKIDVQKAKQLWRKYQAEIDGMLNFVEELGNHFQIVALTTISQEWLDYKKQEYNLDNLFQEIVSSGYAGIAKPNPEIYSLVLNKLNASAKECLFIDDSEKNLLPAEEIGMDTILFSGKSNLEDTLKDKNII